MVAYRRAWSRAIFYIVLPTCLCAQLAQAGPHSAYVEVHSPKGKASARVRALRTLLLFHKGAFHGTSLVHRRAVEHADTLLGRRFSPTEAAHELSEIADEHIGTPIARVADQLGFHDQPIDVTVRLRWPALRQAMTLAAHTMANTLQEHMFEIDAGAMGSGPAGRAAVRRLMRNTSILARGVFDMLDPGRRHMTWYEQSAFRADLVRAMEVMLDYARDFEGDLNHDYAGARQRVAELERLAVTQRSRAALGAEHPQLKGRVQDLQDGAKWHTATLHWLAAQAEVLDAMPHPEDVVPKVWPTGAGAVADWSHSTTRRQDIDPFWTGDLRPDAFTAIPASNVADDVPRLHQGEVALLHSDQRPLALGELLSKLEKLDMR